MREDREPSVSRFRPRSARYVFHAIKEIRISTIWVKRMFTWVRGIAGGMRLAVDILLEYRERGLEVVISFRA